MITTTYNCSQAELYSICRDGWQSCRGVLLALSAYKSKYDETFITTNLAEIDAAEELPNSIARYAPTKSLRVDLVKQNDEVTNCFLLLKGYIEESYRDEKQGIMMEAAGQPYYKKAVAYQWTNTTALLSAASSFMTANMTDLTTDGGMTTAFHTRFVKAKTDFSSALTAWKNSDKDSYSMTDDKVIANNGIYAKLLALMSDVQKVFKKDEAMAKQFTFKFLLSQARGTKAAGVKGKVMDGMTKKTVSEVPVSIPALNKTLQTDDEGRFEFSPLAAGFYTIVLERVGYEKVILEDYEVEIGKIGRLNIELVAVEQTVMA